MKLNLGCGLDVREGWVNADRVSGPGVTIIDMRHHLPWPDDEFEIVCAHHVLDMLTLDELEVTLEECRRVLMPGGVLRISTPDLGMAIRRHELGQGEWLDAIIVGGADSLTKLSLWLMYYGTRRTLITPGIWAHLVGQAGFVAHLEMTFGHSTKPGGAELDTRPNESLFLEAIA